MVSLFEFESYRKFITKRLEGMPKKGYGQMSALARFLGVHSTMVSQILKEHKSLTTDQAALVAEFFGLGELESEYFVLLVQLERAGNAAAKNLYRKQLQRIRDQAQDISRRVSVAVKLNEEQRAVFYSDWAYSAVRQVIAVPGIHSVDAAALYLRLPKRKVQRIVDFLLQTGLCKMANGKLKVGPSSTHVEASSPWVRVHHTNWRQRAVQALDQGEIQNLHYTSPMTLSRQDGLVIKEKLIQFIEQTNSIVDPSPSEAFYCLNIDWFVEGGR